MTRNNGPGFSRVYNEPNLQTLARIHWRASLVPAAVVIPAPIAYIKVVAVKTLVVRFLKAVFWASLFGRLVAVFILLLTTLGIHLSV